MQILPFTSVKGKQPVRPKESLSEDKKERVVSERTAAMGEGERERGGNEPCCIANCGHLNSRFAPVDEAVEHFGIQAPSYGKFIIPTEVFPDRFRSRGMKFRMVASAFAGAGHFKPARPGPVHVFADKCGLISIGETVTDPGILGFHG